MSIPPQITKTPTEIRWSPETLLWVAWQHKGWVVLGLAVGLIVSAAVGALIRARINRRADLDHQENARRGCRLEHANLAAEENMSPPQDLLKSSLIIDRAIQSKNLQALSIEVPADQDLTEHIRSMLTVAAGKGSHGPNLVFKLNFRAQSGRLPNRAGSRARELQGVHG